MFGFNGQMLLFFNTVIRSFVHSFISSANICRLLSGSQVLSVSIRIILNLTQNSNKVVILNTVFLKKQLKPQIR